MTFYCQPQVQVLCSDNTLPPSFKLKQIHCESGKRGPTSIDYTLHYTRPDTGPNQVRRQDSPHIITNSTHLVRHRGEKSIFKRPPQTCRRNSGTKSITVIKVESKIKRLHTWVRRVPSLDAWNWKSGKVVQVGILHSFHNDSSVQHVHVVEVVLQIRRYSHVVEAKVSLFHLEDRQAASTL